jgi:hypothetical protein
MYQSDRLHQCIERPVRFEEKKEDEPDGHAIQQVRKEQDAFEEIFAPDFETQNCSEIKSQTHLYKSGNEIIQTHNEHFEVFRITKNPRVILQSDIVEPFTISIPVGKAVFEHVNDRQISKREQQCQRNN